MVESRNQSSRLRRHWLLVFSGICLIAAALLVVTLMRPPAVPDSFQEVRDEAAAALHALAKGDLHALGEHLEANRGDPDFAYFFSDRTTPRALGDFLGSIGGSSDDAPLREDVDPEAYEMVLTDLAGTLALATHGHGDRAVRASWIPDFIDATTAPATLYGEDWTGTDDSTDLRAAQDLANKQNLLLLLARGYWSVDFLQAVTSAYWDFGRNEGEAAWPADRLVDGKYAPTPDGIYLTDGVLALSAALTANPMASKWAFTEFQPGTMSVDGTDYRVGRFTHFLLFEHRFPGNADGDSVGMTALLTALSSAIEASGQGTTVEAPSAGVGPFHDVGVLQALAQEVADDSGCSWNPRDYWNCAKELAGVIAGWTRRWGQVVLGVLSLAMFAPPPFNAVGISATAANATWYAIDTDYLMAGLSLAAVAPGLAFAKIAHGGKAAVAAKHATGAVEGANVTHRSVQVAKSAGLWRPRQWRDCGRAKAQGGLVLTHGNGWTKAQRQAADQKTRALARAGAQGNLRKTKSVRETGARAKYEKATGTKIPKDQHIDHIVDLQVGGADDIANMKPLDQQVNQVLGGQISAFLKNLDYGTPITSVAIC
jgi:hypothetical protein